MVKRKFKSHKGLQISINELTTIASKEKEEKKKRTLKKCEESIYLTEIDKITKVYKIDIKNNRKVMEITSVAFAAKIKKEWITIVYYDSSLDGLLHKHVTQSLQDRSDSTITDGVRQKGSQHRLLTWAMQDMTKNYVNYKNRFFKRSKVPFKDAVDMQYE